jgi:hypothetical protein
VVYNDAEGNPVVSLDQAKQNLARINELWNPCPIHFELAQYLPVDPLQYHLQFRPADDSELDDIRGAFMVQDKLLVVTTGKWDRSGSLGNTGANAWTSMPGERFYGAVLESEVGTFSNIIAHELGHYMSLDHVRDSSDLMNPIIYDESIYLSKKQCRYALSTVEDFWKSTLR